MHGRPRQAPTAATPEETAKIQQYNKHKTAALAAYKNRVFTPQTLALTSAILALNPDLNSLYNFRKEQVFDLLFKQEQWPDVAKQREIFQNELELSTTSLKKNPKSYHAWYHRIWCIEHGQGAIDLHNEIKLTNKFFALDSRNFHCWNYRRYIARILLGLPSPYNNDNKSSAEIDNERITVEYFSKLHNKFLPTENINHDGEKNQGEDAATIDNTATIPYSSISHFQIPFSPSLLSHGFTDEDTSAVSIESELLFTQRMVEKDFSNYSAWHYRSLLLPVVILRKFIQQPFIVDMESHQSKENTGQQFSKMTNFYGLDITSVVANKQCISPLNTDVGTLQSIQSTLGINSQNNEAKSDGNQRATAFSTPIHTGMQVNQLGQSLIQQLSASSPLLSSFYLSLEQLQPFSEEISTFFIHLIQYWSSIILFYIQFDFSYINMAITITPNDQSPWLYQRWLLSLTQQLTHTFLSMSTAASSATPISTAINTTSESLMNTLLTSNFIPNSDNNVHYTDFLTNPSLISQHLITTTSISDSSPQDSTQYKLLLPLYQLFGSIINTPSGSNSELLSPSYQDISPYICLLNTFTAVHNTNNTNKTNAPLNITSIVQQNQKVTLSTFLANVSTNISTLLSRINPSTHKNIAQIIFDQIILPIQSIQLRLFFDQYTFLTTELFELVCDQPDSQRQPLLGIVILRLCISSLLVTNKHLQSLYFSPQSQSDTISLLTSSLEDQLITTQKNNTIMVKQLLSQPIPLTQTIYQTIQHLTQIDHDRIEYYNAVQKTLLDVEKYME